MGIPTADLIDQFGDGLQSCEIQFRQFGGLDSFHGPVRTVQTLEDNALIRHLLSAPGHGSVLVVDGGGSLRAALLGDRLAGMAMDQGWAGFIVNGAVRDVAALGRLAIGIKALGSNPRKSGKTGNGAVDIPVAFGGVTFAPGNWVYCDEDGIVVAATRLH